MPSVHGLCHDNGMSGRCNSSCEQFLVGQCECGDEIIEYMMDDMTQEEIELELECNLGDVVLFTLRGKKESDFDLMRRALGYYK